MTKNDGGSAFPVAKSFIKRENAGEAHRFTHDIESESGMSLRDYIAVHAEAPIPSDLGYNDAYRALHENGERTAAFYAKWRYEFADAMLKARGEPT